MELHTVRTLLSGLVDYAGLFPPSAVDMKEAVANFAAYRATPRAWMLGRFVVPAARLNEFEREVEETLRGDPEDTWRLSVIIGEDLDGDLDRIFSFNSAHTDDDTQFPAVLIDSVEIRANDAASVDAALRQIPEDIEPFFEVAWDVDNRGIIAAMAGTGARAKIRTGGVKPEMIPDSVAVARFIANCAAADVAFKATAGLHHPVRSEHPLTYEPDAPRGTMHGFLNVFIAGALARALRLSEEVLVEILEDRERSNFVFTEERAGWREHTIEVAKLALVRETFALSFGSCSFDEPVEDLCAINVLPGVERRGR